jgi:spatacsin
MSSQEAAKSIAKSFAAHVKNCIQNQIGDKDSVLSINEYGEKFTEFTKLCDIPSSVGESLFAISQELPSDSPLAVKVNLLLHSSLCTPDIDECAETLDALLDTLTGNNELGLITNIVSVFPDPALLPRYFQYLIAQQKLDTLPHGQLSEKVGRVIMNCARHVHPFEPQNYFDLTLQYSLFRDHAELQMECGSRLLVGTPDKTKLQEASRHYLLALAYFLHEKCYSLSMECLKKLSLISLQLEVPEPSILHLDKQQVLQLMCTKDFPFALTIAVAFDMDTEQNWAEALYAQSVLNKGEEFLTAFQYFRPITSNLCDGVVRKYKASSPDEGQKDRMKGFLLNIPNLVERYRIAKSLDFQDQIESMKEVNPVVCEWCERVLMSKQ